jgi:hypothetical protein
MTTGDEGLMILMMVGVFDEGSADASQGGWAE